MNRLLILFFALILSCASKPVNNSDNMQEKAEILISDSQGGGEKSGFTILKDENEFKAAIDAKRSVSMVDLGNDSAAKYPAFPVHKKVVIFEQGRFNSGDHTIKEIKNISVKNKVLYVHVPAYKSGGMEIMVMSNPWFIFSVPESYEFTSVQLNPIP